MKIKVQTNTENRQHTVETQSFLDRREKIASLQREQAPLSPPEGGKQGSANNNKPPPLRGS